MCKLFKRKGICFLLLVLIVSILNIHPVYGQESLYLSADDALKKFVMCLNNGDDQVFDYIDKSNIELNRNVDNYLHGINLLYEIRDIKKNTDDSYTIKTVISARGAGWNVSGFTVDFRIDKINSQYKITDTTLFEVVGSENVLKFITKIFVAIGSILLIVGIVTVIIVVIVIKNKKKRGNI